MTTRAPAVLTRSFSSPNTPSIEKQVLTIPGMYSVITFWMPSSPPSSPSSPPPPPPCPCGYHHHDHLHCQAWAGWESGTISGMSPVLTLRASRCLAFSLLSHLNIWTSTLSHFWTSTLSHSMENAGNVCSPSHFHPTIVGTPMSSALVHAKQ